MSKPLLPVGKITADVFPADAESYFRVSKEYDTKGVSVSNTMLYRINLDYKSDDTLSHDRLQDISEANKFRARAWVQFGEGKMMADEIIFLRAEVARLSNNEPPKK